MQSKWIHDGSGEPSNGDIKKFVAGIRDLFNLRFDRFNKKIGDKKDLILQVLNDPQSTYSIVVAYTGINSFAEPSARDLEDLRTEMNDASEVLTIVALSQSALHASLTARLSGVPINIDMVLKSWGKVESPNVAYYGQVNGSALGDWWGKFGDRLFARNLRSLLGETDVNAEIRQTLEESPEKFWYFNNGITIIANKITKTMVGGGDTDYGTFHCENISVVNGAQTVSTIGRQFVKDPEKVNKANVTIRIISLETADVHFGTSVTKTNNRQNRIENRDFVTLDPEQSRLRADLGVDGIVYNVTRTESAQKGEKSFDLVEATTALACASGKPHLFVQLKREIGKLWEDISKAPYKELFNPNVNSLYLLRCVYVNREIDREIDSMCKEEALSGREFGIAVHGNRLLAAMVFRSLPISRFGDPAFDLSSITNSEFVKSITRTSYQNLRQVVDVDYQNAIIPTLFKNLTKCTAIYKATIVSQNS